jgi:hypothetical protein
MKRKECLSTKNCRNLSSAQVTRHIGTFCVKRFQNSERVNVATDDIPVLQTKKIQGNQSGRGTAIKTVMRSDVVRILHQGDDDTDDNGLCRHNVHYKAGSPHCLIMQTSKCICLHFVEVNLFFTALPAVAAAQP